MIRPSDQSGLVADGLNEAHRRQVAGLRGGNEIVNIIFVVGPPIMPDLPNIRGPSVTEITSLPIVLKRRVLAIVIRYHHPRYRIEMAPLTSCSAIGINRLQIEATLERAPTYIFVIEQVADVAEKIGPLARPTTNARGLTS